AGGRVARGRPPGLWPAAGLAAAVVAAGWSGEDPLRASVHAVKLILTWLIAFPLLYCRPAAAVAALDGLQAALWLNAGLIALGAAGDGWAAGPSGAGRWGTLLGAEGSLARRAVAVVACSLARLLASRRLTPGPAAQLAAAVGVALLDGSRAALA